MIHTKTLLTPSSLLRVACSIAVTLFLAGCDQEDSRPSQAVAGADLSGTGPGTLVEAKTLPGIDDGIRSLGAEAIHVRYRSTSGIDGAPTVVSGVVFIPGGMPPEGGWPVLAHAHGTSGINNECGPSLSPTLWGTTPMIAGYLKAGFAVAATDYQGLGEPGVHPYLDAKTAGMNVIDSVRALRRVRPGQISARWLTVGGSQGGGATWAANEQASTYATDLHLLGAVAIVPAADVSGYAQKAFDGTLNPDQVAAYVWILMAQSRIHPELPLDEYRRGSVAANWESLSMCYGPRAQERVDALGKLTPDELKPATPEAVQRLQRLLAAMSLPQQRGEAPMLVIYAGKDTYIDLSWTRTAIEKACRLGTQIQAVFQPDKDHGTPDISVAIEWLGQRLAGQPIQGTC